MKRTSERNEEGGRRRRPDVVAIDDTGATAIVIEDVDDETGIQVFWTTAQPLKQPSDESDLDNSEVIPLDEFHDNIPNNDDVSIPYADDVEEVLSPSRSVQVPSVHLRSPKFKRGCVITNCHNDVYTECTVYNPILCYEHLTKSASCGVYGVLPDQPVVQEGMKPPPHTHTNTCHLIVKRKLDLLEWCKDNR